MKKTTLLIAGLFVFLSTMAQEDSLKVSTPAGTEQTAIDNRAEYPWTLGIKGGINYFRLNDQLTGAKADKIEYNSGTFDDVSQQAVLFAEYSFNRFIGLGMYVGNYSFNRKVIYGSSIESGLYAHLNLMECFSWRKSPLIARRLHINLDAGLGGAGWWNINVLKGDPSSDKTFWNGYAVGKAALQFEFFLRPQWSLLFEGEYHIYGRPSKTIDYTTHSFGWTNTGALNVGLRYYFDTRKDKDPYATVEGVNDHNLPIHQKKVKEKKPRIKQSKNAVYVNVNITPDMLEEARAKKEPVQVEATEQGSTSPNVEVVTLSLKEQSKEINGALSTLAEQGRGTAEINKIRFTEEDQLTEESTAILDEIAGSLLSSNQWNNVEMLYIANGDATSKAAAISAYLRAKGVKNLTVKGRETKDNAVTSDLMVSIK